MLKDHEKFVGFMTLIVALVTLGWLDKGAPRDSSLHDVLIGLLGIAGAAAQALFRTSSTEQKLVDKMPPPTGDALTGVGAATITNAAERAATGGPAWTR